MTREDLVQLIARALRRSFTSVSEGQAQGAADTVLRDLKALGIRIFAPRSACTRLSSPTPSETRSTGAGDACSPAEVRRDQDG